MGPSRPLEEPWISLGKPTEELLISLGISIGNPVPLAPLETILRTKGFIEMGVVLLRLSPVVNHIIWYEFWRTGLLIQLAKYNETCCQATRNI